MKAMPSEDPRESLLGVFALRLKTAFDQSTNFSQFVTDADRVKLVASWYDLSLPAVRKWFDAEAFPETPRFKDLAARLGVTVDYLLGEGTLESAREVLLMRETRSGAANQLLVRVPVINPHPGYADVTCIGFPRPYLTQLTPNVAALVVAIQRGDAMGTTLPHGAFALCQNIDPKNTRFSITDGLYLLQFRETDEVTVRRIQTETPGETYHVSCDNHHYEALSLSPRQLSGLEPGPMVIKGVVRGLFLKA